MASPKYLVKLHASVLDRTNPSPAFASKKMNAGYLDDQGSPVQVETNPIEKMRFSLAYIDGQDWAVIGKNTLEIPTYLISRFSKKSIINLAGMVEREILTVATLASPTDFLSSDAVLALSEVTSGSPA